MRNTIKPFEIPSDNPEKSMRFFSRVFGWHFMPVGHEPFWMVFTGDDKKPGVRGGFLKKQHALFPDVKSILVENVDEAIREIKAAGGKIIVPKLSVPSVGWMAYFSDPDGNIHGIMQEDKEAV